MEHKIINNMENLTIKNSDFESNTISLNTENEKNPIIKFCENGELVTNLKTNNMVETITKSNTSQYPSVKTEIVLDNTHNGARESFSYYGELKDEYLETRIMEIVKNLKVGQVLTIKPIYNIEKQLK